MKQVGQDMDTRAGRVAAAVTVAVENKDKPAVVEAEGKVALSALPAPTEAELAVARLRVLRQNPKDYVTAAEQGKALLAKINADLSQALADQAEAKRVAGLKDKRIAELTAEVERVKKEASANLWTLAGVGIAVIGAIATAFTGPRIGLPLLACGAAIGAFPFVIDSPYFTIIASAFLAVLAGLGIWVAYDAARDKVHESDEQNPPPKV